MVLMCNNEKINNLAFAAPTSRVQKAEAVVQIDGVLVVRLANGWFLTSARDFHKWAYPIGHSTAPREAVVKGLAAIGFITKAEAAEHMAEHQRAREARQIASAREYILQCAEKLGIADGVQKLLEEKSA